MRRKIALKWIKKIVWERRGKRIAEGAVDSFLVVGEGRRERIENVVGNILRSNIWGLIHLHRKERIGRIIKRIGSKWCCIVHVIVRVVIIRVLRGLRRSIIVEKK